MAQNTKSTRNAAQQFHILPWEHGQLEKALERLNTIIQENPEDANCLLKVNPEGQVVVNINGAEENFEDKVLSTFSGDYNDLENKPIIPIDLGDLTNNIGYLTRVDMQEEHDRIVADADAKYALKNEQDNLNNEVNNLKNSMNNVFSKDDIINMIDVLKGLIPKYIEQLEDGNTVALKDEVQEALEEKADKDHDHEDYADMVLHFNQKVQAVIQAEDWSNHTHSNKDGLDLVTVDKMNLIESALQPEDIVELQNKVDGLQPKEDNDLATDVKTIVGGINELNSKVIAIQDMANKHATKSELQLQIQEHEHKIITEQEADILIASYESILDAE